MLETSHFHGSHVHSHEEKCDTAPCKGSRLLLFTTKTCPNCKIAKASLDKAGLAYEVIDAEENADLARKYRIMQAPTLVVVNGEEAQVVSGIAALKAYIQKAG